MFSPNTLDPQLSRLPTDPVHALLLQAVSRKVEVPVGLLVLLGLLFIIYLLGEQAGREGPSRSKQLQDISTKKTELKNAESQLASTTTSPVFHLMAFAVIVLVLLKLFGGWYDDDDFHRRRR